MQTPDSPENEPERLKALTATGLLGTAPEERFDRLTRLALRLFGVDIALVSLVTADQQWFKSRQGLEACSTGRDISFCGHAILGNDVLVVTDTHRDPRFADNPLVTGHPHIRFYAGAPLKTDDGLRIGTLCVIDATPRAFSEEDVRALRDLADLVEGEVRASKVEGELARAEVAERRLKSVLEGTNSGTWEWNVQTGATVFNERWAEIVGYTLEELAPVNIDTWLELAHPEDLKESEAALQAHFVGEKPFYDVTCRMRHKNGNWVWVHDRGRVVSWTSGGEPLLMAGTHSDVTERMLERQALFDSEQKFRSLVDNIPGATYRCLLDEHWTMLHMSEQVDPLSGFPSSDFINNQVRSYQSIIHPDDRDNNDREVEEAVREGRAWHLEYRIQHRDGSIRWAQERGSPVFDDNGRVRYLDGFILDVTGEKTLTLDRQRQLEALGTLNEIASNPALGVVDQTHRALELGAEFLGMEVGILGRIEGRRFRIRALRAPDSVPWFREQEFELTDTPFARIIEQDDLLATELFEWRPDGRADDSFNDFLQGGFIGIAIHTGDELYGTLSFLSRHSRERSFTEGELMFMRLLGRWASSSIERHRSLRALRQSEARFRALFELSPIGIALNDFETGGFVEINPALLAPTGYTEEEFVELSYWQVTPREYEEQEQQQIQAMNETGRYGPFEKEYIRKDGSRYPVLLNGMVVRDNSGRKLIWSIIEDISEKKRIERLQNEFIATVSHELRTPLTSIMGALGLLKSGATGKLPETALEMIGVAANNGKRLLMLINDLLDMEKLLAGRMGFQLSVQPLFPILDGSVSQHETFAQQYGVELNLERSECLDSVQLSVDAHRLEQIMANLLSNAIKFSPQGAQVQISVAQANGSARISVTDHGPGIPEHFRKHIFKKFSQADSTDSRAKGGTGLGLAITRELTERQGGRIGFDSSVGNGSCFWVEFPVASEEEAQ